MLALSIKPYEIPFLEAIEKGRRPAYFDPCDRIGYTLKRLADIGLLAIQYGKNAFDVKIELTGLGRDTLEMKRSDNYDVVKDGRTTWFNFYY